MTNILTFAPHVTFSFTSSGGVATPKVGSLTTLDPHLTLSMAITATTSHQSSPVNHSGSLTLAPAIIMLYVCNGTISSGGHYLGLVGLSGGSTFSGSKPIFTGRATPGASVSIAYQPPTVGTIPSATADANGKWSIQLNDLGNGVFPISATSTKNGTPTTSNVYYLTVDNPGRTS